MHLFTLTLICMSVILPFTVYDILTLNVIPPMLPPGELNYTKCYSLVFTWIPNKNAFEDHSSETNNYKD
jgi:hypothetical protein